MKAEVLLWIGESTPSRDDGTICDLRSPGFTIPPAEVVAYFDDGVAPPALAAMPRWHRKRVRATIRMMREWHTHTAEEMVAKYSAAHFSIRDLPAVEATRAAQVAAVDAQKTRGIDTRWGWKTLRDGLVVVLDGLTSEQVESFAYGDVANGGDPIRPRTTQHMYRIDWRKLKGMSAATIAQVLDPEVHMPVKRTIARAADVVEENKRFVLV